MSVLLSLTSPALRVPSDGVAAKRMPLREYVARMNASTEYVFSRLANPDSRALREDFQLDDIVEGALDPTEFFIVRTSNCCRHLCSYLEVLLLCM